MKYLKISKVVRPLSCAACFLSELDCQARFHNQFSVSVFIAGNPFDTTQPVNYAVSNIISAIVYGNRFEYEDPKFKDMVDRANKNIRMIGSTAIQVHSPWICFINASFPSEAL